MPGYETRLKLRICAIAYSKITFRLYFLNVGALINQIVKRSAGNRLLFFVFNFVQQPVIDNNSKGTIGLAFKMHSIFRLGVLRRRHDEGIRVYTYLSNGTRLSGFWFYEFDIVVFEIFGNFCGENGIYMLFLLQWWLSRC